jgi:AMMECR1 domain-containing protein
MARPSSRRLSVLGWDARAAPLTREERAVASRTLRALLAWQVTLRRFPRARAAPAGTPFVSLYADGRLAGCFGCDEGTAEERLLRAFVRALEDPRYGRVRAEERARLAAQVSYPRAVRRVRSEDAPSAVAAGVHGVALRAAAATSLLLPSVARDHGLGAEGMLTVLARKAGLADDGWRDAELATFECDEVTVHSAEARRVSVARPRGARRAGADFLARMVDARGRIAFVVDGRARRVEAEGPMRHVREAVALAALRREPRHREATERFARRLLAEVRAGLAQAGAGALSHAAFPTAPAPIAGTLALACRAGLPLHHELAEYAASRPEIAGDVWHAAQVVAVLGAHAPSRLFRVCVRDLDARPWAPWTLVAAAAVADGAVRVRCERAVVGALARGGPYDGGAMVTAIPELALTALSVESLLESGARAAAAIARGRAFLRRFQLLGDALPASLSPALVRGAFPLSPVVPLARLDVTGHALLALEDESGGDGRGGGI